MGAVVTLELPRGSPVADLPWIITVGPLDEEDDWEPVVCGPYERPHALALAQAVVADDDLMAVVEPLLPRLSADEIRDEIDQAQRGAGGPDEAGPEEPGSEPSGPYQVEPPGADEVRAGMARIAARLSQC